MGSVGGRREGAGRKPEKDTAKKQKNFKLSEDVIEKLQSLSESTGHSQASIIEWHIRKCNRVPKDLNKL